GLLSLHLAFSSLANISGAPAQRLTGGVNGKESWRPQKRRASRSLKAGYEGMFATYYKLTRKNYSRSSLLLFLDKVKPVSCLFFGFSEAGELNVLRRSFRQRPLNFFVFPLGEEISDRREAVSE